MATEVFLAEDLTRLKTMNVRLVLSCLQPHEFALGPAVYAKAYRHRGIDWHLVPIPDMAIPTPELDIALDGAWGAAEKIFATGGRVALHCLAGLGRTGTVAARFAMNHGLSARQAIALIRKQHSSKAIETREQENYLLARERTGNLGDGDGLLSDGD
ncbi:phosphatase domain-containing putative toxin [Radicibacter daui]|uniref:phosphatase domain-containing putative toxin n=1 Tax=Radicibacter daui TaxID=3064829 RepID=UPI0040468C47